MAEKRTEVGCPASRRFQHRHYRRCAGRSEFAIRPHMLEERAFPDLHRTSQMRIVDRALAAADDSMGLACWQTGIGDGQHPIREDPFEAPASLLCWIWRVRGPLGGSGPGFCGGWLVGG